MVSQRRNLARKGRVRLAHGKKKASHVSRNNIKVKKKVTWDKSIALRKEEFRELDDHELQAIEEASQEALPLVTFIRESDPLEAKGADQGKQYEQIKFYLKDGRVDVAEVLQLLGASQLEYEQEPGEWRILEGLESGKSKNRFKHGEVVCFRIIPETQPLSEIQNARECCKESPIQCGTYASSTEITPLLQGSLRNPESMYQGKLSRWIDKWITQGDTVEDYFGRVSRLIEDRTEQGGGLRGVGVVVRLAFHHKHTRLLITCGHMVSTAKGDRGVRGQLYAFGGPVKVLHVSKKYDLALLQGPLLPGSTGFYLAPEGEEQPGREVRLLTFPWFLDTMWGQLPLKDIQPAQIPGNIAGMRRRSTREPLVLDALATYMGGLPGSSGGAVTLNSKLLCGVHSGVYPFKLQDGLPPAVVVTKNTPPHDNNNQRRSKLIEGTSTLTVPRVQHLNSVQRKRKVEALQAREGSPGFSQCMSTHGYLAVYVSSSHIRETCLEWYDKPEIKRILDGILPY